MAKKMNKKASNNEVQEIRNRINKNREIAKEAFEKCQQNGVELASNACTLGKALIEIQKDLSTLKKSNTKCLTFERYCEEELHFTKSYAYMVIKATKVQDKLVILGLTNCQQGALQLRLISKYLKNEEMLKTLWQEASQGKLDARPSYADLKKIVDRYSKAAQKEASIETSDIEKIQKMLHGKMNSAEEIERLCQSLKERLMQELLESKGNGQEELEA